MYEKEMKCVETSQAVGEVDNGERPGVERPAAMAAVAMSMAGAGLLGWWVWAFRPLHQQMWMVPASLVMFGTPIVVLFSSIFATM
ncbi:hypothetical protein KFK09_018179 [Dendrobium nobile]|uniref:Transmembrane protein n=1 Tax=Dendrobium nobile TaxID=94219 RepID=A0A8T3AV41_DENNO|nr:hypothetical protein KFK09_018179 [Dendrobium nobile]